MGTLGKKEMKCFNKTRRREEEGKLTILQLLKAVQAVQDRSP